MCILPSLFPNMFTHFLLYISIEILYTQDILYYNIVCLHVCGPVFLKTHTMLCLSIHQTITILYLLTAIIAILFILILICYHHITSERIQSTIVFVTSLDSKDERNGSFCNMVKATYNNPERLSSLTPHHFLSHPSFLLCVRTSKENTYLI